MDVFNEDDRRSAFELMRSAKYEDGLQLFVNVLNLAVSSGKVEGGREMAERALEALNTGPANPAPQLEEDIRKSVLAKFTPRGHLPETGQ